MATRITFSSPSEGIDFFKKLYSSEIRWIKAIRKSSKKTSKEIFEIGFSDGGSIEFLGAFETGYDGPAPREFKKFLLRLGLTEEEADRVFDPDNEKIWIIN